MAVKMFAPNYHDIPLFKGLGRDEINEVLHKFHGLIKHFPKSDYIYLAGDCIENLCVVMEGTVQMIKEDIWGEKSIIANLSAGDVFAENYLGKLSDRSVVSYFAASDSEILMLPLGRMLFAGSNHNETNLEQEARYNGSDKFTIPFNRTDLANYLDADRSALTRELARMRADGLISFEKNTFEILEHSHTE